MTGKADFTPEEWETVLQGPVLVRRCLAQLHRRRRRTPNPLGLGDENYRRLQAVKAAYDPDNVFRSNHNVPPLEH